MRAVVQRTLACSVVVAGETVGQISSGLLVYLGVEADDDERDARYLADKVINLRIFEDDAGKMNLSVSELGREILVVSQFTLQADARKGRRPSYNRAAAPEKAEKLYRFFLDELAGRGIPPASGSFGAHMEVQYTNDGPVTILIDSKKSF